MATEEPTQQYVIYARADGWASRCYMCEADDLVANTERVSVRDLPLHGIPCVIKTEFTNFRCNACGFWLRPKLIGIEPQRKMTVRLRKHLEDRVFKRRYDHLATDYGVSEALIRTVADELADRLDETWKTRTPRVLGIDDIKIGKKARTVFVDSETGEVLAIADSKEKEDVLKALTAFDRSQIKALTMDMDVVYRDLVRQAWPQVRIVFDKFHVAQRANKMMNDVRLAWQNDKRGAVKLGNAEKWAFRYRRKNLLERKDDLYDRTYLPDIPMLTDMYRFKESFLTILNGPPDSCRARKRYSRWRGQITSWLSKEDCEATVTLKKSVGAAVTSFVDLIDGELDAAFGGMDDGLSNARVENANGWIRTVEGVRQGYSYEVLKDRILYGRLTPSTDLFECDVCDRRYRGQPIQSVGDIGGSWNDLDPTSRLRHNFCDVCWDVYTVSRSEGAPIEMAMLWSTSREPIRTRNRVQRRKSLKSEQAVRRPRKTGGR